MVTFKITKIKSMIPTRRTTVGPYFEGDILSSTGRHYEVRVVPWQKRVYTYLKKEGIKTFYNTGISRIGAHCKETKEDVFYNQYGWEESVRPKSAEMKALIRYLVKEFGEKPVVKGAKTKTLTLSQHFAQERKKSKKR